jgi:hypothetical protein
VRDKLLRNVETRFTRCSSLGAPSKVGRRWTKCRGREGVAGLGRMWRLSNESPNLRTVYKSGKGNRRAEPQDQAWCSMLQLDILDPGLEGSGRINMAERACKQCTSRGKCSLRREAGGSCRAPKGARWRSGAGAGDLKRVRGNAQCNLSAGVDSRGVCSGKRQLGGEAGCGRIGKNRIEQPVPAWAVGCRSRPIESLLRSAFEKCLRSCLTKQRWLLRC